LAADNAKRIQRSRRFVSFVEASPFASKSFTSAAI
jgi:hypothetical protein